MNSLAGVFATLAVAALALAQVAPARATEDLCALLAPTDFQAAGVPGARAPTRNPDQQGAYCVYAGKSSATGGIEFDVFVTAGSAESQEFFTNMRSLPRAANPKSKDIPDADEVEVAKLPGPPAYTTITVRKGKLVFDIGVPTSAKSQEAVISLARLVLQRADKLTR
jgi:hypothetical protein